MVAPLLAGQTFEVSGERWRFCCPTRVSDTSTVDWPEMLAREVKNAQLVLKVSSDEEHVELGVRRNNELVSLGSRSHNYLLLYLARQRLADTEHDVSEGSVGWVYRDELLDALKIDRVHLNIAIFRIRKQFEAAGLHNAAGIIERRPSTQQLRIGVSTVSVESL